MTSPSPLSFRQVAAIGLFTDKPLTDWILSHYDQRTIKSLRARGLIASYLRFSPAGGVASNDGVGLTRAGVEAAEQHGYRVRKRAREAAEAYDRYRARDRR